MRQEIASAFRHRQRPTRVTDVAVCSSLRDDALHFEGIDWENVSALDWLENSDAFFGFSPIAFAYFLPSILMLSADSPMRLLPAADALIEALDTSADPEIWDEWFVQRFGVLTSDELSVLKQWAFSYVKNADEAEGSEFARVRDTLLMLELTAEA